MTGTLNKEIIKDKGIIKSFIFSIFLIFSSSIGVFVGFLWRDIFLSLLKKYDLYNNEEGFERCGIRWGFLIAFSFTIVSAFFAYLSVTIC